MKNYIYQGIGADGELTKIGEVENKTSYTVSGLKPKTIYRFAVSAYNGLRESDKSDIITVTTAAIPVATVTLSIDKTALEVGGTAKATVTITPENTTDGPAKLTSSNPTIATIDSAGAVKALAPGTTDINATVGTVSAKLVTITVYEALVSVSGLAASATTATSTTLGWTNK